MTIVTALHGHTSEETAYLILDYPYGFKLRCQMKAWLEAKKGKGYRFVTRTTNPKVSFLMWNKPKASTYHFLGGMFIDENGHVQWTGVDLHSDPEKLVEFGTHWPEHKKSCKAIVVIQLHEARRYQKMYAEGKSGFAINGVPTEVRPKDIERNDALIIRLEAAERQLS